MESPKFGQQNGASAAGTGPGPKQLQRAQHYQKKKKLLALKRHFRTTGQRRGTPLSSRTRSSGVQKHPLGLHHQLVVYVLYSTAWQIGQAMVGG
jgi:hypothetical protein